VCWEAGAKQDRLAHHTFGLQSKKMVELKTGTKLGKWFSWGWLQERGTRATFGVLVAFCS
jgi:hypothetical protein